MRPMQELRPIGTEFDYVFPPDPTSSTGSWTVWRYRVAAHDECVHYKHGPIFLAERLEPLEAKKYRGGSFLLSAIGTLLPIPPPEIAGLWEKQVRG